MSYFLFGSFLLFSAVGGKKETKRETERASDDGESPSGKGQRRRSNSRSNDYPSSSLRSPTSSRGQLVDRTENLRRNRRLIDFEKDPPLI